MFHKIKLIFILLALPMSVPAASTSSSQLSANQAREILGVGAAASNDEIKLAYRRLVKQYHPDRNLDPSSTEVLKVVNNAYEILENTQKSVTRPISLEQRFETIIKMYNLGTRDTNSETALILIQKTQEQLDYLLKSYFSKNSHFSVTETVQRLHDIQKHMHLAPSFLARMVAENVGRLSRGDHHAADELLAEYAKGLNSSNLVSGFLKSNLFNRNNPVFELMVQQLISENKFLDSYAVDRLVGYFFNANYFSNHFKAAAQSVRAINIPALWDLAASIVVSDNTEHLTLEKLHFVMEGFQKGITDKSKIKMFSEIAQRNPTIFESYRPLYRQLMTISDYSEMKKNAFEDLHIENLDALHQKYVHEFLERYINLHPEDAEYSITWEKERLRRLVRNPKFDSHYKEAIEYLDIYLAWAKRQSKSPVTCENLFAPDFGK